MKCPYCQVEFREDPWTHFVTGAHAGSKVADVFIPDKHVWSIVYQHCSECNGFIVELVLSRYSGKDRGRLTSEVIKEMLVYPRVASRPNAAPQVPQEFAEDFNEAALILQDSPKASAALSRRCLQHVLREKAGVKHQDLAKEIQEVLAGETLPPHLAEAIDAVRHIGNFGAHPIKSKSTGEIVPVEPGEADWNLDVLNGLFEFYFVQPEVLKQRRAALDAKLSDAGKPPLK